MRRLKLFIGSAAPLFLLPVVSSAQGIVDNSDGGRFGDLLGNILGFANDVLVPFILGIGFLVFVWGMFQYFIVGGSSDDGKEKGKSLMIYATLGFLFIIIFYGIVNLLASSTGLEGEGLDNVPSVQIDPA